MLDHRKVLLTTPSTCSGEGQNLRQSSRGTHDDSTNRASIALHGKNWQTFTEFKVLHNKGYFRDTLPSQDAAKQSLQQL